MDDGRVVGLVPVRGLRDGKTRLAANLSPEARAALTARMLRRVVRATLDSGAVSAVGVVSPEEAARRLAVGIDPAVVALEQDPDAPGLNAAIDVGRDWAMGRAAAALLILFGDLPLLSRDDVRAMVETAGPVVLAGDRHGTGTNGMLLRLDGAGAGFRFRFGAGSLGRHVAEAERLGLGTTIVNSVGTAIDLDTPEDLRLVLDVGEDGGAPSGAASFVSEHAGPREERRP